MYSIKCLICENGAFKTIRAKKNKSAPIPYFDFLVYADAYLKGPITISYHLPTIEDSTDNYKVFEYSLETAGMWEVWQIYAEDSNFEKCIIRHAVWDKTLDKTRFFRKNEEFLKLLHQGERTDDMLFDVNLHADTVLCRDTRVLRKNILKLEKTICKSIEIHEKSEQAVFIEKGLIIEILDSSKFTFLWNYPNSIGDVDVYLQEICLNMKDVLNNAVCEDLEVELIYEKYDYDMLGL